MLIKKLLRRQPNDEIYGFRVIDEGESYIIPIEALHLKDILDSLLKEGYVFNALPYVLSKDGKNIYDSVESEVYTPTPNEEQEMYDLLENPMYSNDDLKNLIVVDTETAAINKKGEYTITTREDFLKFLKTFNGDDAFAPAVPINYFVSPEALFTVEEYYAKENKEYIEILNNYRRFNFTRWKNFLAWANRDFNDYNDIIQYYFSWGLDGLYFPVLNTHMKMLTADDEAFYGAMDNKNYAMFTKREIGFIDGAGTILVPDRSKDIKWHPVYSREYVESLKSRLQKNQVEIIELETYTREMVMYMEGKQDVLRISLNSIKLNSRIYSPLRVYANGINNPASSPELWIPKNLQLLAEDGYMRALAKETLLSRIAPCSASSVKALGLLGLSKPGILRYIVANVGADKQQILEDGTRIDPIDIATISAYCEGNLPDGSTKEYLDDILAGNVNVDCIASAIMEQQTTNLTNIYNKIYALTHIFHISLDELYDKINSMGESDSFRVESNSGYFYIFQQPMNRDLFKAFYTDVKNYRMEAAFKAKEYIYIIEAFREMGTKEANRHVGISAYVVNATSSVVRMCLEYIKDIYKKVVSKVSNQAEQMEWMKNVDYFAASKYFEAALYGRVTLPKKLGAEVVSLPEDIHARMSKTLNYEVDILTAVCEGNEDFGQFRYFFVNAYVGPDIVIPIKNHNILQMDFIAAWKDWTTNPQMYQAMLDKYAISETHKALELYATSTNSTITEHVFGENTDLYYYHVNSNKYVSALGEHAKFTAAPHPTEYLWPGVYGSAEDSIEEVDTIRAGRPKFELCPIKILKFEQFKEQFDIEGKEDVESAITPYYGLTASDINIIESPLKALEKVVEPKKGVLVVASNTQFFANSEGPLDYRELPKYVNSTFPIINMYGRVYVFRDMYGKYWRCEV